MRLLCELLARQSDQGWLSHEMLRRMAAEHRVPLYRLEELVSFYTHFRRTPPVEWSIDICRDVCCSTRDDYQTALADLQTHLGNEPNVEIREVSCLGRCDRAPAFAVNEKIVSGVGLTETSRIADGLQQQSDFFSHAPPPTIRRSWCCDPYDSPEHHYATVRKLASDRDALRSHSISQLIDSGLRGRGGAAFPTGQKWQLVAQEFSPTKYVICNADESEPGTFKDRVILEQLPHLVIEGMVLAGLAVGAQQGIIFLRHEYGPERIVLEQSLAEARSRGVLGDCAAGSNRAFDIELFVSPGGYILGEETALLEALEDQRGEPRNKPPYPVQSGLWGQPTLINNVETFALATSIIHHGAQWWHAQGVEAKSGLKFVCISGDVQTPGVFEVPVGTTYQDVVDQAGGPLAGIPIKAFFPGGASSTLLKRKHLSTAIDFDSVKQAGSMLGTGAIMVFNEQRDLYKIATGITRFFRNESCGKCVPCRIGTEKAVRLLETVGASSAASSELTLLPELDETLRETSICGLGQIALAPVCSLLQHFPEEVPGNVR